MSCFSIADLSSIWADALRRQKLSGTVNELHFLNNILREYGDCDIDLYAFARNNKNYHAMLYSCQIIVHLQIMQFPHAGTSIIPTFFLLFLVLAMNFKG